MAGVQLIAWYFAGPWNDLLLLLLLWGTLADWRYICRLLWVSSHIVKNYIGFKSISDPAVLPWWNQTYSLCWNPETARGGVTPCLMSRYGDIVPKKNKLEKDFRCVVLIWNFYRTFLTVSLSWLSLRSPIMCVCASVEGGRGEGSKGGRAEEAPGMTLFPWLLGICFHVHQC